jgi:hypothetical protein
MKKLSLFFITLFAAAAILVPVFTAPASADLVTDAQCNDPNCVNQQDKAATEACNKDNGCDIVAKYLNPFIKFLGVTVGVIWGGIEYSSSGGDPQKSASGKDHITMAIIALLGYFFIYAAIHFLLPGGTTG